ncbi:hypothetical protein C8A05DRAFT_16847, partial [Staphylotrichum tortipilum]
VVAGVKVVLKKEVLEGYERRLETALRSLYLVVQLQMASSNRRQPEVIAARVVEVLASKPDFEVEAPPPPPLPDTQSVDQVDKANHEEKHVVKFTSPITARGKVVTQQWQYDHSTFLLGTLSVTLTKVEDKIAFRGGSQAKYYRFRVAPPPWLLQRVWDVQISMACSGWNAVFTPYTVVPMSHNNQLIRTIRHGTFGQLLELFDKGLASPFVVDELDFSLIHYAMVFRTEFVERLVHLGRDMRFGRRPAYAFPPLCVDSLHDDNVIHRFLVSQGAYDDDVDLANVGICRWMATNSQIFDWLLANKFPDFYQRPLNVRLGLFRDIFWGRFDYAVVGRIFRPSGRLHVDDLRYRLQAPTETIIELVSQAYFTPMLWDWSLRVSQYHAADRYHAAKRRRLGAMNPDPYGNIRIAIRGIAAVADYTDIAAIGAASRKTVLLDGITSYKLRDNMLLTRKHMPENRLGRLRVQALVRGWVEEIQAGGKDLELYGKAELAAFIRQNPRCSAQWAQGVMLYDVPREPLPSGYRWRGLTAGSRPEDWRLVWEWDPDVERLAGEFWTLIEDPPLVMPGSWVDDEDDDAEEDDDSEDWWLERVPVEAGLDVAASGQRLGSTA